MGGTSPYERIHDDCAYKEYFYGGEDAVLWLDIDTKRFQV